MNTRKVQDFVVKGKEVFVGLEDSKKTWKIAVRCDKMLIHRVSMPAKHQIVVQYLRNKFPECTIHLIYEAGFRGFNLFDRLTEEGIDCMVIPPHLVTEPKVSRVKTDKRDANRLAMIRENHDFKEPCCVPDKERREDRQISRTLWGMQKDIVRTRNRIRKFLDFNGIEVSFPERWGEEEFRALKELPLGDSLKKSLTALLTLLEQLWGAQGITGGGSTRPLLQGTIQEGVPYRDGPARDRVVHRNPPHPRTWSKGSPASRAGRRSPLS